MSLDWQESKNAYLDLNLEIVGSCFSRLGFEIRLPMRFPKTAEEEF